MKVYIVDTNPEERAPEDAEFKVVVAEDENDARRQLWDYGVQPCGLAGASEEQRAEMKKIHIQNLMFVEVDTLVRGVWDF